jgi:ribose transport system substrate-binding protein
MGGLNWHAQETIKRLKATYPNLDFVLATAGAVGKQVNDIEDMMATRNIDALVVLPFESEPLTSPVKAVKDAGKWVTVVDRGLSQAGIEDLYVAGDNTAFGRVAGEYFRSHLKSGAKIVVLRGIPTTLDNERVDAFQKAIEGSGIEILDMQHGNWNRDKAFSVMQDYLSKHKEMWVVGGAGMKEIIKRVMDKDTQVPVDVSYPPALISSALEITALRFVSDTPVYGRFIIGSTLITPENAARFYFPNSPF